MEVVGGLAEVGETVVGDEETCCEGLGLHALAGIAPALEAFEAEAFAAHLAGPLVLDFGEEGSSRELHFGSLAVGAESVEEVCARAVDAILCFGCDEVHFSHTESLGHVVVVVLGSLLELFVAGELRHDVGIFVDNVAGSGTRLAEEEAAAPVFALIEVHEALCGEVLGVENVLLGAVGNVHAVHGRALIDGLLRFVDDFRAHVFGPHGLEGSLVLREGVLGHYFLGSFDSLGIFLHLKEDAGLECLCYIVVGLGVVGVGLVFEECEGLVDVVADELVGILERSAAGLGVHVYYGYEGQAEGGLGRFGLVVLAEAGHHVGVAVGAGEVGRGLVLLEEGLIVRAFFHHNLVDVVDDVVGVGDGAVVGGPGSIAVSLCGREAPVVVLHGSRTRCAEVEQVALDFRDGAAGRTRGTEHGEQTRVVVRCVRNVCPRLLRRQRSLGELVELAGSEHRGYQGGAQHSFQYIFVHCVNSLKDD